MWIRSQNKQVLINANCIDIDKEDDNFYKIYAQTEQGVFYDIGNYSTEAKALKVLYFMQIHLLDLENAKNMKFTLNNFVFQMPLDSEVEDYD